MMSFLLSSSQFDRKDMDHNLLLKKSFRKSEVKSKSPKSGLNASFWGFCMTRNETHTVELLWTSDYPAVEAITHLTQQVQ